MSGLCFRIRDHRSVARTCLTGSIFFVETSGVSGRYGPDERSIGKEHTDISFPHGCWLCEGQTAFSVTRKAERSKILFSTVIEEKNERKAFEIGPNAHFYLDENVVWDLHFIIFFDICSMFLVNSISCPVEDGTAAPGNPVHPILYNRPDNRCPGNSPHSCSSMSPISDLV